MFKSSRRRAMAPVDGTIRGIARVDRRTKNLLYRLQPGEIAVIDHVDLDRIAAEGLVQCQAAAVVNASQSSTGRYPNLGPLLLCSAGIRLIDQVGAEVMKLPEGTRLMIDGNRILVVDNGSAAEVARGRLVELTDAEKTLDESRRAIATVLEEFADNTISYIRAEREVLLEASHLPQVKTDFHGRHVLIVVRGYDYKEDLAALRSYIREVRPILIGVDGGADALLESGLTPEMIIGDMDSVSNKALHSGAELVVHAYPGGVAPGAERINLLGLPSVAYEASGTSEDIAMLLAYERGAELIVAVGTHANLIEFLDKGRRGMASTFLTRLRVGPILMDAKGLSRIYRGRIRGRDLLMLVAAAVATMAIVVALADPLRYEFELFWEQIQSVWFDIREAIAG